ncbi:tumor necrosis factor ligand superfamily member 15 [Hemicordylus capensis]|uniref:tumor necrosis factor ligand superfamily member 15 n=1 Tax=Hemicordylus capensis TaxID=884348 RepID=UPI002304A152|nr:tumor necrosis factor ligand superfamily member 15 [Hemicordylus capensis]
MPRSAAAAALEAPLQEFAAWQHSSSSSIGRSCRRRGGGGGELSGLRCLVACCLLAVLLLALPVAFLLDRAFRQAAPPADQQEAEPGRSAQFQKQTAMPTSMPVTTPLPGSRPKAYLTADSPEVGPCVGNQLPILKWRDLRRLEDGNQMLYKNGFLVVPKDGEYFIYSQITFRRQQQNVNCTKHNVTAIKGVLSKRTGNYVMELMSASNSITMAEYSKESIYLGSIVLLREGDELMVNVSHTEFVYPKESFFGAFFI